MDTLQLVDDRFADVDLTARRPVERPLKASFPVSRRGQSLQFGRRELGEEQCVGHLAVIGEAHGPQSRIAPVGIRQRTLQMAEERALP